MIVLKKTQDLFTAAGMLQQCKQNFAMGKYIEFVSHKFDARNLW